MKKLLFIEDDPLVGRIYSCQFQWASYHVELAENGNDGIRALSRFQPDLIILDLMLPGINGVEIIKHVRAQPEIQSLPIVVLTNAFVPAMLDQAKKAGADLCLIKAETGAREILAAIDNLLKAGRPPGSISAAHGGQKPGTGVSVDLRADFLKEAPKHFAELQTHFQTLLKTQGEAAQLPLVLDLYRKAHTLTASAALAEARAVAHIASALEALLKELQEKPKNITASTLRTTSQTIDLIGTLLQHSPTSDAQAAPFKILAVDDETFSRKAVTEALAKANLTATAVEDPAEAYALLQKSRYDLVITDIDMPGMDGFELCENLRALPGYSKTPVIFVTGLNSFDSRLRTAKSGGDDFIGKPFLFIELAVKALTLLLRGRLQANSPEFRSFSARPNRPR